MAPTPTDVAPPPEATQTSPAKGGSQSTAGIVAASIFGFFVVSFLIAGIGFWYHKRAERKKLPPEHRRNSYRPYRSSSSKNGLLANAAPTPENDDKSSMFSRDRSSSRVSLMVDPNHADRRVSMEQDSLIPLHITPAEEGHDSIDRTGSTGSGVSSVNESRYSQTTGGSLGLSNIPIPAVPGEDEDLGVRRSRPRSTSTASARYYENTPTDTTPQIPKIVHTPSP